MQKYHTSPRIYLLPIAAIILSFLAFFVSATPTTYGQDVTAEPTAETTAEPTLTPEPSATPEIATITPEPPPETVTLVPVEESTTEPTVAPTDESTPAIEPTIEATSEATPVVEATEEATLEPTVEITDEVTATPEATEDVPPFGGAFEVGSGDMEIMPLLTQTYCRMNISDRGDSNPLTYNFSVTSANIVSWEWDFGDSTTGSGQSVNKTYAGPGTYTITLTCTPATGSPLVLTGTVQVSLPAPVAYFTINEGIFFRQIVNATTPLTLTTNNRTSGSSVTYSWTVTRTPVGVDANCGGTFPITTTNLSCSITDYGTYTFSLTATNASGSSTATQDVVVLAPPPDVDFTIAPDNSGQAPYAATFAGVIASTSGPITTWAWDFNGDGTVDDSTSGQFPPAYTYTVAGLYGAKLRATGPGGFIEVTRSVNVFTGGTVVNAAFTMTQTEGASGGNVEVCFTNNSTGDIGTYEWDFGDNGSIDETTAEPYFCRTFPPGLLRVLLRVRAAANPNVFSEARRQLNLVASPVAAFTYTPNTGLTQDTQIDFSSSTSTGIITSYAWDFNGDGTTDSTEANPQDRRLLIGNNRVRLTVTGPGGSSSVEQIIAVARLEITCAISGNFTPLPTQLTQSYGSNVGNVALRPVTYSWSVTGAGGAFSQTGNAASFAVTFPGVGTYQLALTATTPDGSLCSDTETVTIGFPPLVCNINNPLPSPLYPNGQNYTFNASVTGDAGRALTYSWSVNGGAPVSTSSSYTWTNPAPATSPPYIIRYDVVASDGSTCYEQRVATITPYPAVSCTSITGAASPIPVDGSGVSQNIQYTANLSGFVNTQGQSATYSWTANGATSTTTNNPTEVRWPLSYALNGTGNPSAVDATITVTTPGIGVQVITCPTFTANVRINNLVCNNPFGDLTPVVGENNTYTINVSNLYGRTPSVNWVLSQEGSTVASGTGNTLNYTFGTPGLSYTLFYDASVTSPQADTCSRSVSFTVTAATQSFACDAFPSAGNNFNATSAGNYAYIVDIDNGNGLNLRYDYVLIGPNGGERIVGFLESTANGLVTGPAFSLNQLGPIGNYALRVDVRAVGTPPPTAYTCSLAAPSTLVVGSLNVAYSYERQGGGAVNNSAVEVGTTVCFTNTSAPIPPVPSDPNALTYTWTINGSTTTSLPGCYLFGTAGTYIINLIGVNNFQGDTTFRRQANATVTFNVYNSQGITITRSNQVYAPDTVTFTANGVNITGSYNWTFYNQANPTVSIGTRTGGTVNFGFNNPGTYRAFVVGTGPLGNTTAELIFTLIDSDDVLASFRPSQYAGIAPLTVCFTDTSQGLNLTNWSWNFGNGQTLNYTNTTVPSSICTTYTAPDTDYTVTLTVTNAASNSAIATNVIRTYSPLESGATFTITPAGNGRYCFTAQVPNGVTVTGWNFGDGSTAGALNTVCHQFQAVGDFRVQMFIQGPGPTTGVVERVVTVTLTSNTPNLSAAAACAPNRTATFTITNSGSSMTTADQVVVRNASGNVIDVRPVQLASGGQLQFSLTNLSDVITLSLTDNSTVTASTTCNYPPQITVTGICQGGEVAFRISNGTGSTVGPMYQNQSYQVFSGATPIASGNFQLATGGETVVVVAGANPYGTYRFVSSDYAGTFDVSHTCGASPSLTLTGVCTNVVTFTITNSGGAMVQPQTFTVVDSNNNNVSVATNSFQLAAGASVNVEVPVTSGNPYIGYTLSTTGFAGTTSRTQACSSPALTITGVCTNVVTFTITNTGSAMVQSQTLSVVDSNNVAVTVATNSFQLATGASVNVEVPVTSGNPYVGYTLSTTGFAGTVSRTQACSQPALTITAICTDPVRFTITNTGAAMVQPQTFTVEDGDGNTVSVATNSFQLAAGASQTVDLTGYDPYIVYTLETTGNAGTASRTQDCVRPVLSVTSACTEPLTFTITNSGRPMLSTQSFQIVDAGGNDVTPSPNTFQLGANQSVTVSPTNGNPYAGFTLTSNGYAGDLALTQSCAQPVLAVAYSCVSTAFTVTNSGGAMLSAQSFQIVDANGNNVTPATNTFQLGAGATTTLTSTSSDPYATLTITSAGFAGTLNDTFICERPVLGITPDCGSATFTVRNIGGSMTRPHAFTLTTGSGATIDVNGNTVELDAGESTQITIPNGIDPYDAQIRFTQYGVVASSVLSCQRPGGAAPTTVASALQIINALLQPTTPPRFGGVASAEAALAPDFAAVPVCGFGCPTFRLYHTDETGDWEIFRLDSANEDTETTQRENLSLGEGEGVDDMAPSISPNDEWIVFTSNRATVSGEPENWEIYVAPTGGGNPDAVERVTYNTTAIDTDPVWGPNNWVVFETNRNGNWDLYAIDMATGIEYQLTDDPADDINPFWSPDGQRLAFQSGRTGEWQIFELDLLSEGVRQLSDDTGIDVDPMYSFDGTRIAFRSYSDEDGESRIGMMNANGSERRFITTADENATNHTWSPDDALIAFQSDLDGDLDIYVYEVGTETTRQLSDNDIPDYAPTWRCAGEVVTFTSDIAGNPDIYEEEARPIEAPPVLVEEDADQLTFEVFDDIYPQITPPEENASREGRTILGIFGEQTSFLQPAIEQRPPDFSIDAITREDWDNVEGCP